MTIPTLVEGVLDAFVQARWFYATRQGAPLLYYGLHTPEGAEVPTFAEDLGRYFATTDRPASTHFGTDNNSAVRYLPDTATAFAAKGINRTGLHVEIAGRAGQSAEEWADDYSRGALERAAAIFRLVHEEYDVPARILSPRELERGTVKGIVTHATAYQVHGGDYRSDPGEHFPADLFLALCRGELAGPTGSTMATTPPGDWWRILNNAPRNRYASIAEYVQRGLRHLTDPDTGEPYYGEFWRIDGKWGPISRTAWRNFERDLFRDLENRRPKQANRKAGPRSWAAFLNRTGTRWAHVEADR